MSSSNLFGFDNSFVYKTISPAQDGLFFETAQEIQNSVDFLINETNSWEEIASLLLSSSPPPQKSQLESSSLGDAECSVMEVKREKECQLNFGCSFPTFSCYETAVDQFMQTTYGNNYCHNIQSFPFGPPFDHVFESKNSKNQFLDSPESICSNGDSQKEKTLLQTRNLQTPFSCENSSMAEANCKVRRYSAEERRERIHRYRAKRTLRNFNKTIKYACRKTLADSRKRIRGRFVRSDEVGEILKASLFQRCEDKYDLWGGN